MSFESCGLLKSLTISCDKPIGLFGAEDGVDLADGCEPAGAGGPVRVLDVDDVVLKCVGFD